MFTSKDQENGFLQMLEEEIKHLTRRTKALRISYYTFSILTLFLSGILTVLLGFNNKDVSQNIYFKNWALITGTLITFLSGINTFWRLESYWVRRKIYLRKLKDLRDEFNFKKLSEDTEDLQSLFVKYQSIKNYTTEYWEEKYNQSTGSSEKGKLQKP